MTLYFMFTCKQSIFIHFAIFEVIFVTIRHAALIMVECHTKIRYRFGHCGDFALDAKLLGKGQLYSYTMKAVCKCVDQQGKPKSFVMRPKQIDSSATSTESY